MLVLRLHRCFYCYCICHFFPVAVTAFFCYCCCCCYSCYRCSPVWTMDEVASAVLRSHGPRCVLACVRAYVRELSIRLSRILCLLAGKRLQLPYTEHLTTYINHITTNTKRHKVNVEHFQVEYGPPVLNRGHL